MNLVVGIDPGTNTGLAALDRSAGKLVQVSTMNIIQAMHWIEPRADNLWVVVFEDARLRKGKHIGGVERLQGVGSIKRDCVIWDEFFADLGIAPIKRSPLQKGSKVSAEYFQRLTGWTGRTSEHARDAAMLIWALK